MASESEQEKRETLADIERDLRDRADCAERHGDRETHNDGVATLLRSIADRIEAIDSADAWRSLYTPGNAAAMREALGKIAEIAKEWWNHDYDPAITLGLIIDRAGAALSAPARNCDMPYEDRVEMYGAFKDWCKAKGHTMGPMLAYDAFDWLLAPAAERKGEGDGR